MNTLVINGKRKRKLDDRIARLPNGTTIRLGISLSPEMEREAQAVGFSAELPAGETLLPPDIGSISRFNSEGKEKIHEDQPMETAYRQREWSWTEYHGRYNPVERTEIVDVPYERYPRSTVPPPSVELSIAQTKGGKKMIVTPEYVVGRDEEEEIVHGINLILEVFGHCLVFTEDLEAFQLPELRHVNWQILPAGTHPWIRIKESVEEILQKENDQRKAVVEYRLEKINAYSPEFVAVGRAGFSGYLVFGFPDEDLFVLESIHTGNATYVFASGWEELSKKTKAEILHGNLQEDRIIHRKGWELKIENLLSNMKSTSKRVTSKNLKKHLKPKPRKRIQQQD
jgi:hypothetical protein